MSDDRQILVSYQTCVKDSQSSNGKDVIWTTDIRKELPIKLIDGVEYGSETPITVSQLFIDTATKLSTRKALLVEREGKVLTWTWAEYQREAFSFAKSLHKLNVRSKASVAIMGFNSPEWVIAFVGTILNNQVNTGIYSTNAPEAIQY